MILCIDSLYNLMKIKCLVYFEIYEPILPKKDKCSNLLVPVCLSRSIRMEPVFMVLGQSAAVAASLALREKVDLHDLDYQLLLEHLLKAGQLLKIN
jgi:hypothetical protein